ncbi:hypothetical protein QQX98_000504 [Neonectria punicea]|uniref:C2H2-type domain-containing protein n=1 Tax=Neonectria punicea TaxID=979145 RepID=A0ABR1HTP4_9HYPO
MTSRATSPESDRAGASVLELTKDCISMFERCPAPDGNGDGFAMETRLADLRLWADGVGAIAEGNASLEWRFRSRLDDLMLVKTILVMLADFIDDYSTLLSTDQPVDDAVHRVDSAIENLALIGVAIRRTGKASRRRRADTRFDPADYEELRRHLECIILLQPSKSGLEGELNPSSLSIVQKRLIEANLMRRHRFVVAQKRSRKQKGREWQQRGGTASSQDSAPSEDGNETKPQGSFGDDSTRKKGAERVPPTKGGLTAASTAEGTLQYGEKLRYVPGAARTQITALAADTEFPRPPPNPEGRRIGRCPCCCQSIPAEEMMNPGKWRQHVVEDLLPYTCIIEDCPAPNLLFATRKEWDAHVKTSHRVQWHCPLCEESDLMYQDEKEIVHHFESQHQDDVRDLTLSTLLPWSETQHMGITSCPLCSSFGREDSPEIVDHALRHIYEFSLRALPWTKPVIHDLAKPVGTYTLPKNDNAADRIVAWVNDAASGSARELQLSGLEPRLREVDVPEAIDVVGYVPDDEYFDDQSVGGSSKPQVALTEPARDSYSVYTDSYYSYTTQGSDRLPYKTESDEEERPRRKKRPNRRHRLFGIGNASSSGDHKSDSEQAPLAQHERDEAEVAMEDSVSVIASDDGPDDHDEDARELEISERKVAASRDVSDWENFSSDTDSERFNTRLIIADEQVSRDRHPQVEVILQPSHSRRASISSREGELDRERHSQDLRDKTEAELATDVGTLTGLGLERRRRRRAERKAMAEAEAGQLAEQHSECTDDEVDPDPETWLTTLNARRRAAELNKKRDGYESPSSVEYSPEAPDEASMQTATENRRKRRAERRLAAERSRGSVDLVNFSEEEQHRDGQAGVFDITTGSQEAADTSDITQSGSPQPPQHRSMSATADDEMEGENHKGDNSETKETHQEAQYEQSEDGESRTKTESHTEGRRRRRAERAAVREAAEHGQHQDDSEVSPWHSSSSDREMNSAADRRRRRRLERFQALKDGGARTVEFD